MYEKMKTLSDEYYTAFFKETILAELEELDRVILEQDWYGINLKGMFELISTLPVISYKEKSYSLLYVDGIHGVYGINEYDEESDDCCLFIGYNEKTKEWTVFLEGGEAMDLADCEIEDYENGCKNLVAVDLDMRRDFRRSKQDSGLVWKN